MAASAWAVRDELWKILRELRPDREPRATGRPRVPERIAFHAVVYVLVTGIAWSHLPREGGCTGPSPVDRARTGSKHHLLTDATGVPLAVSLTGGNRNDITRPLPLNDGLGPVPGKAGRPRRRPERLLHDPPAADPLRATGRAALGLPAPGLCADLLAHAALAVRPGG